MENQGIQKADLTPAVPKGPERQWTVVFDLKVEKIGEWHDKQKVDEIKALAASTKNLPVTIIVQSVDEPQAGGGKPMLSRIEISNGVVHDLGKVASKGYDEDLGKIVDLSAKNYPSQKMALVVNAHGNGNQGMAGDAGPAEVPGMAVAVRNALNKNGRGKLDVLDFDACLMAQTGSIATSSYIANHLVASEEVEWMPKYGEGQKPQPWLKTLLATPTMNGGQLADAIVAGASDNNAGTNSTPTISHLDMAKFPEFTAAQDRLGKALLEAEADPNTKREIGNVIDRTAFFSDRTTPQGIPAPSELRDLKDFTDKLGTAILSGKIPDQSGEIRKSIFALNQAQGKFVKSYYGSNESLTNQNKTYYRDLGGISALLPGKTARGTSYCVAQSFHIPSAVDPKFVKADASLRNYYLERTDMDVKLASITFGSPAESDGIKSLEAAAAKTRQAMSGSDKDFWAARDNMQRTAEAFMHSPVESANLKKFTQACQQEVDGLFDPKGMLQDRDNWVLFVEGLRK